MPPDHSVWGLFSWWAVQGSNRAALTTPVGRVSNQPSGLLLSPRFPTPRNVYQERCRQTIRSGDFLWWAVQDSNRAAAHSAVSKATVRLCLARGSQRLGMSTGMTAVLWWAVQDENRNEQRQGITMVVVFCLLLFLIEYGILGSVQQICIWRIESCGMN